jgi:hypothetical protein
MEAELRTGVLMGIVFSDESLGGGTSGPISIVTALMINMSEEWAGIRSDLKKIVSETPTRLLRNGRELKGADLYGTVRKARRLRALAEKEHLDTPAQLDLLTFEKAEGILRRLLHVASRTLIMSGAVDVLGYRHFLATHPLTEGDPDLGRPDPAEPRDIAFDLCVARVEKQASRALLPNERLVWIHDHLSAKNQKYELQRGLRWIAWLRSMGRDPETKEYIGENQPPLRVIPPIYFGDPEGSFELQLADVCCSTIRLKLIERFYPNWLAQQGWEPMVAPFCSILEDSGSIGDSDSLPYFMSETKAKVFCRHDERFHQSFQFALIASREGVSG